MAAAGRVIALAVLLAAIGCRDREPPARPPPDATAKPSPIVAQLERVTGATVVRLRERNEAEYVTFDEAPYLPAGEPVTIDARRLDALRAWARKLEPWPDKKCEFTPAVRIDLGGAGAIEICFACGEVRGVEQALLGAARPAALAWVKALFPDDATIQAID